MIDIETLREYYKQDSVFVSEHAANRYRQRGIKARDVRTAIENGEIIEQYPEDHPFPSCLILGKDENGDFLHVCMSDEGSSGRIITAYHPDIAKWNMDLKIRKEI